MTAVVVAGQAKLSHYDAPQNGARNSFTPRLGDTLSKHTYMENHRSIQRLGGRDRRLRTLEYVLETEGYTVTLEYADPALLRFGGWRL